MKFMSHRYRFITCSVHLLTAGRTDEGTRDQQLRVCGAICRGDVAEANILRSVRLYQERVQFVRWNYSYIKVSLHVSYSTTR